MIRVLFLEDEPTIQEVLCEYMKLQNYEVITADNGNDTISLVDGNEFEMAVLDVMVPGASGFEVLKHIHEHNPDMATIMLTALDDENSQVKAFNLYADDYIIKPVTPLGFRQSTMLAARLIAYFIFMTGAFLIYTLIDCLFLDIKPPTVFAAFCYILTLYLLGAIFFILSHGIAGIFKKFGPTYAVTMTLYFCFMILCGLMGIKVENLPKALRMLAYTLPMTYVSKDYIDFWSGGSYNFGPIIQAFLFLGAICVIVLMYSIKRNGRIRK